MRGLAKTSPCPSAGYGHTTNKNRWVTPAVFVFQGSLKLVGALRKGYFLLGARLSFCVFHANPEQVANLLCLLAAVFLELRA
jgi:hypothetical protein